MLKVLFHLFFVLSKSWRCVDYAKELTDNIIWGMCLKIIKEISEKHT